MRAGLSTSGVPSPIGWLPEEVSGGGIAALEIPRTNATVTQTEAVQLTSEHARALLRKLRDLNLTSGPVAVGRRACVELAGCLSLDAPVEKGVRYRVLRDDGSAGLLEIAWQGDALSVAAGELAPHTPPDQLAPLRRLHVAVTCDRKGRACAKALGARVAPDSSDRRALEHFLRRVVKTMFR